MQWVQVWVLLVAVLSLAGPMRVRRVSSAMCRQETCVRWVYWFLCNECSAPIKTRNIHR